MGFKARARNTGAAPAREGDGAATFAALKAILRAHERDLIVMKDSPDEYYLNAPKPYRGRDLFFGAVQVRKSYVSYHLFPVYMMPELLDGVSPALQKRMQGKSCFNFRSPDEELLRELDALTRRGLEALQEQDLA